LGEDAVQLGLPAGLLLAGELGEVAEGLIETWVVGAELGEELVADFVAGVGGVGVGGVFAPGLVGLLEKGFDVGSAGVQEGAEDLAGALVGVVDEDYGMDGAEAFGPGSAEELHEDGLGLVVEGVGGEDAVGLAGGDEGGEVLVADGAGGFFDGLVCLGYSVWDAGLMKVEGDVEAGAEGFDEALVGVGLFAAEAVVDVDGA
jgi:hypothetical protein